MAQNPYTSLNLSTCGESTKTEDFTPGESGRVYLRYPNGNAVFAFYGRAMNVNENENRVGLWIFASRGIDWTSVPSRRATVTLTEGVDPYAELGSGYKDLSGTTGTGIVEIKDGLSNRALIRATQNLTAEFDEGPVGLTRHVVMPFNSIPLLTGSPDVDNSTLAGVGPNSARPGVDDAAGGVKGGCAAGGEPGSLRPDHLSQFVEQGHNARPGVRGQRFLQRRKL